MLATLTNTPASSSSACTTEACVGGNASFNVTASGTIVTKLAGKLLMVALRMWNNVSPAVTTTTLTLTGLLPPSDNNNTVCQVNLPANPVAVNSNATTLTLNSSPAITTQPANAAVCRRKQCSVLRSQLQVPVLPINGGEHRWLCGPTWDNIAGAISNCLTVNAVTASMNNYGYRCVVSGNIPAVTTNYTSPL